MKSQTLLAVFLSTVILIACKSSKPVAGSDKAELTETYWRLIELNGKPTGPTPADKREIHIKLRKEGNNLEGFAGCNGIGGHFEIKEGDRISFTNIIGTMMACPDLDTENSLLQVLKMVDNYNLNGKNLVLNKARMAPLARFEAVYFK